MRMFEKPEGKRPFEGRRCRWENNIKMDLKETDCEGDEWIRVGLGRVQSLIIHQLKRF
jgi:hypothetical protein